LKIKLIVAASENNIIGKENDLPWNLPDDMLFFKKKTLGSTVIMGRKNYLSIPQKYRPLPNRFNIVLTTNPSFLAKECLVLNSLEEAINTGKKRDEDVFIIGGGTLYRYALQKKLIDVIYLTRIHAVIKGDTYFPKIDQHKWNLISNRFHPKDERHKYDFTFMKFEKIN
tara:strand:+ start:457 stop:963 length:507 start_codon:yes stop_codon:yes gene_type:complete